MLRHAEPFSLRRAAYRMTGSLMVNTVPSPSVEATSIVPPCSVMTDFTINSPILLFSSPARFVKRRSNMWGISSSDIPVPLSSTRSTAKSSSLSRQRRYHSPFGREAYRVEHKVLEYAYKLLPVSVYHDRLIVLRQKFKRYAADIDVRLIPGIKITQQQAQIKQARTQAGWSRPE